jgi:hypothetical protein
VCGGAHTLIGSTGGVLFRRSEILTLEFLPSDWRQARMAPTARAGPSQEMAREIFCIPSCMKRDLPPVHKQVRAKTA